MDIDEIGHQSRLGIYGWSSIGCESVCGCYYRFFEGIFFLELAHIVGSICSSLSTIDELSPWEEDILETEDRILET